MQPAPLPPPIPAHLTDGSLSWLLGQSAALVVAVLCLGCWLWLERREKADLQRRNEQLSAACLALVKEHSDERVQTQSNHALAFECFTRNVADALSTKPKS